MTRFKYIFISVVLAMVVSFCYFLPAQNIEINEVKLKQLELGIKSGLEKKLRVFSRAKHIVSVQGCAIEIASNFTDNCISPSENTKEIINIYLPEVGSSSMYIDKLSGDVSFMFRFLREKVDVIKKSREVYLLNKPKSRNAYKREDSLTPTKYKYDFASQQSQKYLKENGVVSSQVIYTCRAFLHNQLFFGGIILHFEPGDLKEIGVIFEKINKYKKNCISQINHN